MAAFNAKLLAAAAVTILLAIAAPRVHSAVVRASTAPIVLDAQSFDADLNNNNELFHKVRISQGDMSIVADLGQGTQQGKRLDFDKSLWIFRGNVKITVQKGQLTSDVAEISFDHQILSKAVVNGKPAAFSQHVAKTGKDAEGHAETIDYDAGKGIVHLSKNAWLSIGQYEVSGESLKYNVQAQNIVAEASEQESQRVHIVVAPPPSKP